MKIFVLQNPKAGRAEAVTDFLPIDGALTGDAPRCGVCDKYVGMRPLLPPVRVGLEAWGPSWGDVVFGPGDQVLISDRLKGLVAEAGLRGFLRCDPVDVVKVRRRGGATKEPPPNYSLASIVRSRALLDAAASGLERDNAPVCAECGLGGVIKRLRRIVLQPNSWSGEDVFIARGLPGTILTTERFKSLCDSAKLANCSLVPAEAFSFDYYPDDHAPAVTRH
jgi:hypothetical protein